MIIRKFEVASWSDASLKKMHALCDDRCRYLMRKRTHVMSKTEEHRTRGQENQAWRHVQWIEAEQRRRKSAHAKRASRR